MSKARGLADLMQAYLGGDEVAYRRLDARLRPSLIRAVRRIVGRSDIAEDLVQAALIRAHRARGRFDPPPGDPDAAVTRWYFAIARNAALDFLRAQGAQAKRDNHLRIAATQWAVHKQAEHPEALALQIEEQLRLESILDRAIGALPSASRGIIEGRLRGETLRAISERMGIHHGTARVRAHRAYKALATAANMAA